MADTKITALTALTAADPANDVIPIVDVSDTSMAASGTTKKISVNNILGASGTATLASATITGDLTVDTNTLKVDSTNDRVGIGTASPADSLHIFGSGNVLIEGTAGIYAKTITKVGAKSWQFGYRSGTLQYEIQEDGVERYTIGNGGTPHIWYIGAATAMTLNATGLAIGDTPFAGTRLTLRESASQPNALAITNRNATQTWRIGVDVSAVDDKILGFYDSTSTTFRMQLTDTGNLGIGVTPSAWQSSIYKVLEFARGVSLSGQTDVASMELSCNAYIDSGFLWTYKTTAAASHYRQFTGQHQWFTAPSGTAGNAITFTQAMTLDASGNLLVGTTSAGGNRLNVQTASGDCTTLIKSQAANVNSAIDYVTNYGNHTIRKSGTAVWDFGVINDASATPAFKVSNASAVGVQLVSGATSWTTLSDETMKDIIEPISNAVSKVGSLRSVIGKFKTDDSSKRRSFLIAQDVQSVLPEAVDVIGDNNELGLRYTEVIPLLVAAIKELTAEVNALKNA